MTTEYVSLICCVHQFLLTTWIHSQKQPTMIVYALIQLVNSLAEVIGAEQEFGKAVGAGWAQGVEEDKLEEWRAQGEPFAKEIEKLTMNVFRKEYERLYSQVSVAPFLLR